MVKVEGKDQHDFQVENLKLYYKKTVIDIQLIYNHYLQNHCVHKKFISSADRQLEKGVLTKCYHMVKVEGKDQHDFQVENLKLYYKKTVIDIQLTTNF